MKRILSLLAVALIFVASAVASETVPELRFRNDGTFKIMQVTDMHLCFTPSKTEVSKLAIHNLGLAIAAEKPDLVILTGDAVFAEPATPALEALTATLSASKVPFVWLNGNHDTEQDLTLAQITDIFNRAEGSIVKLNERGEMTEMSLTVKGSAEPAKAKAILYLFDTHSDSLIPGVNGYDWLYPSQIDWYRKEAAAHTQANGGHPLPAMAFFHIPTQEWITAFENDRPHNRSGIRMEEECPAQVNSGLIAAMLEQGDVMALFCGHDHDNDYIANNMNLAFGYGRFSGAPNVYIDLLQGYRIINLLEGKRDFNSYIRLIDGRIIDHYRFSDAPKTDEQRQNELDSAAGINYSKWMAQLPDAQQINRVSIPSTHDSGAKKPSHDLCCQILSIADQLKAGIRGFDMRLKADPDGSLGIYHAEYFQNITWEGDVLPTMVKFLKENPSEVLVVSVKREGNSPQEYAKRLAKTLADKRFTPYIAQGFDPRATVGDLRGKIVLILRDGPDMKNYPGAVCSGWDDNVTCPITLTAANGTTCTALVEDIYGHRSKWRSAFKVKETMKNIRQAIAADPKGDKWFISFASATSAPADGPREFADIVNPGVAHELQNIKGSCGLVLVDFAGTPAARDIVRSLIQSNF